MTRSLVSALALAALAAGCGDPTRCGPRADHTVVACVDDTAITAAAAREHLRGADGDQPPRAAMSAVEAAIRVQLFADEAVRRKLAPSSARVAVRNRQLIDALAAELRARPEDIDDDDAAAAYQAKPGRYSAVEQVRVRAIFVDDEAAAAAARAAAEGLDDEGFAALARARSRDPSADAGGDLGVVDEHTASKELVRLATALRVTGDLAGPHRLADGRFLVMRATEVVARIEPLEVVLPRVKAILARAASESVLASEDARLRTQRRVRVFADAVAHLVAEPPP